MEDKVMKGLRYNKNKLDLTQMSPLTKILQGLLFMYGQYKYELNNYKFFKKSEDLAIREFEECRDRHLLKHSMGEFLDPESGLPHLTHANWNNDRIVDIYYYGMTHMKDGIDLFKQPFRRELPTVEDTLRRAEEQRAARGISEKKYQPIQVSFDVMVSRDAEYVVCGSCGRKWPINADANLGDGGKWRVYCSCTAVTNISQER